MEESAPAEPNYTGAAQATAQGNLENLEYQTQANRPDQQTPWGSTSWTQTPNTSDYNNAMSTWEAEGSQGPAPTQSEYENWDESESLTPAEQEAETGQQNIQVGQTGLATTLENQEDQTMANGFQAPQMSSYMGSVPGVQTGYTEYSPTGPATNTNAPQFSDATAQSGAQSAYDAEMDLEQPQMTQAVQNEQGQLEAQGLAPGSTAYNNAMESLNNSQAQQTNSIAANAVQTGDEEANQNYASELSGFNAGNTAQSQNYGEGEQTYQTGQQALEDVNQAQQQDYTQELQDYQNEYADAYQNYMEPLNAMNAVMNGNQVATPSMPGFDEAGTTNGADYSTAAQEGGLWESGQEAENAASGGSMMSSLGSIVGDAGMLAAFA